MDALENDSKTNFQEDISVKLRFQKKLEGKMAPLPNLIINIFHRRLKRGVDGLWMNVVVTAISALVNVCDRYY